ncbi:MAG TPA: nitrous oxide reductase family maturation protein NosD, partial [Devosia sp.]|nr:nitrous oxide reductase family maturation protein NosD [Devosia sp.]
MLFRTLLALALLFPASFAPGKELRVKAGGGELASVLQTAQAGDILRLLPGTHSGPVTIDVSLTIDGNGQAAIEGNETGSVVTVTAPDVVLQGLTITGSGSAGENKD